MLKKFLYFMLHAKLKIVNLNYFNFFICFPQHFLTFKENETTMYVK